MQRKARAHPLHVVTAEPSVASAETPCWALRPDRTPGLRAARVEEVQMRIRMVWPAALLWAAAGTAYPGEPTYEFKAPKAEGSVEVRVEGKRTVYVLSSERRNGRVVIRLKSGDWPRDVTLRLNKSTFVDTFSVMTDRIYFGMLPGSGDEPPGRARKIPFTLSNARGEFEDGTAGTLDVTVVKGKAGLDFRLPANLFVGSREVKIDWGVYDK
jgi:hypothetical protein